MPYHLLRLNLIAVGVMQKKYWFYGLLMLILGGLLFYDVTHNYVDWRTADRSSAGIAPSPDAEKRAVVQLYVARTYNWRKYFAVHPWIAVKEKNAKSYTVYQVLGFKQWRTGNAVDVKKDIPDRHWYGMKPVLLQDLRGEEAEKAISEIKKAVETYPFAQEYRVFPGPNSNTFVSYIIRHVPELTVELPPIAIGKDFIGYDTFLTKTESGKGYQISFWGVLSVTFGKAEGLEINILGLVFGVDFLRPALKLPFVGRLGVSDAPLDD